MDPVTLTNLALIALNGVLRLIAELKSQGGLSDDQILDQAKQITAGNDQTYAALVAVLKPSAA